jgi:hypothetical protein
MTLSEVLVVVGSLELVALPLALLSMCGRRKGRTRLALEPRAEPARLREGETAPPDEAERPATRARAVR